MAAHAVSVKPQCEPRRVLLAFGHLAVPLGHHGSEGRIRPTEGRGPQGAHPEPRPFKGQGGEAASCGAQTPGVPPARGDWDHSSLEATLRRPALCLAALCPAALCLARVLPRPGRRLTGASKRGPGSCRYTTPVAVTASVVTRTPRLTSKGHRPPAHSRVLTEHLVIPVNVASALRPGPRFCPAHDGLPVTSPAAHPHPCSPHPRSALAGEPDGPGEGVRPSCASRGGPTSRHLAPSETRCPRFQTTARKRGVPRCPDTQL